MVQTKEEIAAYAKAHYEKNKEKIRVQDRARYEKNKVKILAQKKARYEKNKDKISARNKAYKQTPSGKKSRIVSDWKKRGVIGDLSKIYDERYLPCTHCEACNKEFSSNRDRCLDHCHETGLFRKVLCQNCNRHDNWKKYI